MSRSDLDLVEPGNRAEWRSWLEANHESSLGVWLAVGKKGNSRTTLTYDDAVEEALCFGWIDSIVNTLDDDRFKQRFTPRKAGGTWSRSNKIRVERLIAEGLMTPAGAASVERAKADGSWTSLDDVEGLVVPDDLGAALAAEPGADRGFADFSDTARKMALYWIASARRPETRSKRLTEVVRSAAEGRPLW